jgi:hypothetical protein
MIGLSEIFLLHILLFSIEQVFHDDMASRTSVWLSCDHTFKSAANIVFFRESDGRWIKLFKCVFCVLGKNGQILHWRFTREESFQEVRGIFLELRSRLVVSGRDRNAVFYFSRCSCETRLIPCCATLLKDSFCWVTFWEWNICKQYGLIFRKPSDLGEKRTQETADANVILKNLLSFELKWSNMKWKGYELLNTDSKKAIYNLKIHIEKGCLSGIPVQCSTSGNERLHRSMNTILQTNKIGLNEMAY